MNPKITISKAINSALFSAVMLFATSSVFAQVKIGNNPTVIGANSNLEVESSNGTKVVVDKTTGFVGAGVIDPTQSVDGAGTGRLRNIPISTTNTQILTVDQNGVIYKQASNAATMPVILGSLSTTRIDVAANETSMINTGATITLPANSKYIVNFNIITWSSPVFPTGSTTWLRGALFDSPTSTNPTADVIGSPMVSGLMPSNARFTVITGAVQINNTLSSPKTYYYKVGVTDPIGPVTGLFLKDVGWAGLGENQIWAIPVNN